MASQRFCLRWNNHQSNLLSVFDQLLHAETFTDVTLAIDGQYLKAHKMVLSACSPYFQALFVNHPEKHPIVILKDIPFSDMKSLLDFMYRGEVSVDQERLSAFLRVAESLRIKGLTEVNDDKPSSRDQSETPPTNTQNRVHPYVLQQQQQQRKVLQQQQSSNNPLLGTALSMPKRKRGRPRKLSGSDDVDECEDDYRENLLQESPELLEVKMGAENDTNSDGNESRRENDDNEEMDENGRVGSQDKRQNDRNLKDKNSSKKDEETVNELVTVKTEPMDINEEDSEKPDDSQLQPQIRVSNFASQPGPPNLVNVINQLQQKQNDAIAMESEERKQDKITMWIKKDNSNSNNSPILVTDIMSSSIEISSNSSLNSPLSGSGQKTFRRRIRRKHNSPDDQAEALTEMSVRGLNLFRYASIQDGVYKCTECAKESVQKTFKNKYSFQRHAFLYHEGTQRKVFPCPVCRKEFSRPDKMKNHMKMTHECYMPKECKFPLPLIIAGASSQSPVNNNILNLATTQ